MSACLNFSRLHLLRQFVEGPQQELRLNYVTDGIFGFFHYTGWGVNMQDFIEMTKKKELVRYVKGWLKRTEEDTEQIRAMYEKLTVVVYHENKLLFTYRKAGPSAKKLVINFSSSKAICEQQ
ncbi:MAG TPA: hypothetical protein VNJ01_14295 [Bacteriovoracaceae bacterium]|nr:hypothetical protein [Bacteriovoracaceae bacterium]